MRLTPGCQNGHVLVDVFDSHHSKAQNDGAHRLNVGPYGWRWLGVGAADNVLNRSDLDLIGARGEGQGARAGAGHRPKAKG